MSVGRKPARKIVARSSLCWLIGLALALTASLPAGAQYFGKNRVQYRDFDWRIYHSTHFDVYYYTAAEHQLQKTVSLAESAYDELSRVFDYQIQEPTPLIVYQTHSAFLQNNIIINGVPEGAQAFATPVLFRMVLPLDLPDNELLALIKHELTHIFQYHILFRGKLGAGLRGAPPQWFIEGGASYFADDETPADRKYMIDAVVNDRIPSVQIQGGGFMAYRFGHAVFDFIEERWGQEAALDLFYELRNTLGGRINKAIERTFRMDVEDFDAEFRRWARDRYLPALLETGEPGDFGKPYRLEPGRIGQETSPVASPSGDLLAAFTTDKSEVDISLFDTNTRRRISLLTKGLDTEFQWILAQSLSFGRRSGRDLSFSPDGNYLAAFARREAGYSMILIDVLNKKVDRIIDMDVEQQLAPAWHPDGKHIAFSGNRNGQFDIYVLNIDTLEIENLTNDEFHNAGPSFSPDGKHLVYSAFLGDHEQIFRMALDNPMDRFQITQGEHSSKEPIYSLDGQRLYFTSDRGGAVDNIWGLDLTSGQLQQYTNAVTGCDQPTVLPLPDGGERLVYTGYWKGNFSLYMTDVEEPVGEPVEMPVDTEPVTLAELPRFEPDIEVSIDDDNIDNYGGKKFFIEDVQSYFGYDANQVFVGRATMFMSDYLGDRRIIADVSAVDTLSDFTVIYADQSDRWQWQGRVFNYRQQFFQNLNPLGTFPDFRRTTISVYSGAEYSRIYPFSLKNRVELTAGAYYRDYRFDVPVFDPNSGLVVNALEAREDTYPQLGAAFVSDSTIYNAWGPLNGHRVRISASYAPNIDQQEGDGSTLVSNLSVDARKYVALGRRSNLAMRFAGSYADGDVPNLFFMGGLDTVRGYNFREFIGFRGFYANAELRFPLIDQLAFPGFQLRGIRGVLFFDVGGTWFPEVTDFTFYEDGQLQDAVAAYGWGFTVNMMGLSLNWDFARRTQFADDEDSGFETQFWIGTRF